MSIIPTTMFLLAALFSITTLSTSHAFADDDNSIVDEIDITVPVSCSLSGTGMDTHITELHNTESDSSIGESTITAYCNDLNGFSIYAVGFTNNEYGNNYLIDSNLPSTTNIATGTATSGNTSQWAMKLSPITNTNPAPTYPIIITGTTEDTDKTPTTLNYTSFQPVPNEYALVAKRKAATDVGTNAEGSSFKTTYQAYVSPTQNAGTYTGQVRYVLVHPHSRVAPVFYNTNADDISEVNYLQEFAKVSEENKNSIIASMVPEQQYTLKDSRDGKSYTIAKLKVTDMGENMSLLNDYQRSCSQDACDEAIYNSLPEEWKAYADTCRISPGGTKVARYNYTCDETLHPSTYNLWMTKNLALDLDARTIYTSDDTDIGYNAETHSYGDVSWQPMRSTYTSTNSPSNTWCIGGDKHEGDYCVSNPTPESYNPGELYAIDMAGLNAYVDSCRSNECDETLYDRLSPGTKEFYTIARLLMGPELPNFDELDYSSFSPDTVALIVGVKYVFSCLSGTCDETLYTQLTQEMKLYIDSCDENFESCDTSLIPFNIMDFIEKPRTANSEVQQYHLGNYYNWAAIKALNQLDETNLNANQSICPAGWTLPYTTDFDYLLRQYGLLNKASIDASGVSSSPLYLVNPGLYVDRGLQTMQGGYWAAYFPQNNPRGMIAFSMNQAGVDTGIPDHYGLAARCILRTENHAGFITQPLIPIELLLQ